VHPIDRSNQLWILNQSDRSAEDPRTQLDNLPNRGFEPCADVEDRAGSNDPTTTSPAPRWIWSTTRGMRCGVVSPGPYALNTRAMVTRVPDEATCARRRSAACFERPYRSTGPTGLVSGCGRRLGS
jgi:hypothetical protein